MTQMMNTKPKLSVAVPVHDMPNKQKFFKRLLESLWNQTFQDFEIIVTDNSDDDEIKDICDWYRTGIRYFKNPRKGMAPNTNGAIRQSRGELIKILYMDDFMAHDEALEDIINIFTPDSEWLVTGCAHVKDFGEGRINPHFPRYNPEIHTENTIGSPSVLTVRNHWQDQVLFDENLTWLLDADLYKRLYAQYGPPVILKEINVIIGIGKHQMTHQLSDELKLEEHKYTEQKHA